MRRALLALLVSCIIAVPLAAQNSTWMRLPGMRFAGQITRDANGVAHIRAFTDYDAAFLNGYVHANDRLFQMDFNRRQASGTLAELVGPSALPTDVQLRTLGLRRAASVSELELSPQLRQLLGAYAAGVNAWIGSNALPPEYTGLEITKIDPWTPLDTVAVGKLLAFGLSFDLDVENTVAFLTYQGAGQQVGFDGVKLFSEDLFRSAPFDPASTVPDATKGTSENPTRRTAVDGQGFRIDAQPAIVSLNPDAVQVAKEWADELQKLPYFQRILDPEEGGASNEWAIAGKLSATGNPMIANDPHLALGMPSTFYPIAIRGNRLNAAGMGFPGIPFVVHGHNERIAWGSTVNPMDVTDAYQEQVVPDTAAPAGLSSMYKGNKEALFPILQTFRANNLGNGTNDDVSVIPPSASIPQATLIVSRRNAPIVSLNLATGAAVSVQWIGHGPTREIEAFYLFNQARNLEEFKNGLQYFDVGSQNFIYTDSDGNIAYFTSGEMPIREDLQAGTVTGLPPWFLRNGSAGGNDWIKDPTRAPNQASGYEILPFSEMPQIVNPAGGWIVNANNDPAGTTLDNNPLNQLRPGGGIFYLNVGYSGFRAGRITQLIREKLAKNEKFTVADMQRIQADVVLLDAQYFVPHIKTALDNARTSSVPALAALGGSPAIAAAVQQLSTWDYSTPTGIPEGYDSADVNGQLSAPTPQEISHSVSATIYSVWRGQFIKNTIDAVLGVGNLPRPSSTSTVTALRNIFDNFSTRHGAGASGVQFLNVPGIPNDATTAPTRRDILILKSLADALALITSEEMAPAFAKSSNPSDWRWGKLHRIVFRHALGGAFDVPSATGPYRHPLPGLIGYPVDGGFEVVDASSHSSRAATLNGFMFGSGPVRRAVSEATPTKINAVTSLPGGPSGVITSPLYANLLFPWLTNEAFPIDVQTGPTLPWGAQ
jgi:penicillin amidase